MIYSITGELVYADPNMAAVNVNGIAFQCDISLNTFQHLICNLSDMVKAAKGYIVIFYIEGLNRSGFII